jgi:hypothetical protein
MAGADVDIFECIPRRLEAEGVAGMIHACTRYSFIHHGLDWLCGED